MSAELVVVVDRVRCRGYANCLDAAPDVFSLDDDDVAIVARGGYPASDGPRLEDAARRCPAKAIRIERLSDGQG